MKNVEVADSRIYSLMLLYDMHTGFFAKAIERIPDNAAQSRLDTQANHMAWITGSLVQQRFEVAGIFGVEMQQTANELFNNYQGIRDGEKYPPLEDFKADWDRISPVTRELLSKANAEKLDSMFDMGPMKMTHLELLSFMIYREANCIGQLALWRRLLGYPALKYDE